jgi:hypothetical protein
VSYFLNTAIGSRASKSKRTLTQPVYRNVGPALNGDSVDRTSGVRVAAVFVFFVTGV